MMTFWFGSYNDEDVPDVFRISFCAAGLKPTGRYTSANTIEIHRLLLIVKLEGIRNAKNFTIACASVGGSASNQNSLGKDFIKQVVSFEYLATLYVLFL